MGRSGGLPDSNNSTVYGPLNPHFRVLSSELLRAIIVILNNSP